MNALLPGITVILLPTNVREWSGMYRQDVRTIVHWEELLKYNPKVGTVWLLGPGKKPGFFFPWAVKGHWMTGATLRQVELGDNSLIVRAPAVRWRSKTVLLDGCHRTSQLQPKLLIVDVVECGNVKVRRCFADLLFDEKGNAK